MMIKMRNRCRKIVMITISCLLLITTNHVAWTYVVIPLKTTRPTVNVIIKPQQQNIQLQQQIVQAIFESNRCKLYYHHNNVDKICDKVENEVLKSNIPAIQSAIRNTITSTMLGTLLFCSTTFGATGIANAETTTLYDVNDYASETVQRVIKELKDNTDSTDGIVKVFEEIASIITEGKGVGGSINYQGIQLERGFVSDEDTTIYNPGLSLLTESEKYRLLDAIVESKRIGTTSSTTGSDTILWNIDTQAGYEYLRDRLDPYHTYELQGFLKIVPFYGAALYMIVLGIQQLARDVFPPAYIISAIVFFIPLLVLVSFGPQ